MPAPSSTPQSKCWAKFVYQKISAVAFIQDKQGDLPASSNAYFAIGSWDDHADNSLSVWAVDGRATATGRGAGMIFSDVGVEFHTSQYFTLVYIGDLCSRLRKRLNCSNLCDVLRHH